MIIFKLDNLYNITNIVATALAAAFCEHSTAAKAADTGRSSFTTLEK